MAYNMVWTWPLPVYGPNAIMIQGTMHKLHGVCSVIIMILILVSEFRAVVDWHVIN